MAPQRAIRCIRPLECCGTDRSRIAELEFARENLEKGPFEESRPGGYGARKIRPRRPRAARGSYEKVSIAAFAAALLLQVALCATRAVVVASSSSSSSSSISPSRPPPASPYYQPTTALDKYGNSPQIRNAGLASSRHGSLVVSAISPRDGTIAVCSLYRPRMGVKRIHPAKDERGVGGGGGVVRGSGGHAVRPVAIGDGDGSASVALICSGVRSDAALILSPLPPPRRRRRPRDRPRPSPPGCDRTP